MKRKLPPGAFSELVDPDVQRDLQAADSVFVKLDAATDEMLQRVNRPIPGVTVRQIVENLKAFKEVYRGHLAIQSMFMPMNKKEFDQMAELYKEIQPDEVQLNTPMRAVPKEWYVGSRGNHGGQSPVEETRLKVLSREEAGELEAAIRERTGLKLISVYQETNSTATA